MEIRKAGPADLDNIMGVYAAAREFMIRTGNPTQWGRTKPTRAMLEADIAEGSCCVITHEGGIHAVFVMRFGEDPTYRVIENGAWPDDGPYVTIHRIAGDGSVHGVLKAAADFCAARSDRIRVDTHENNHVMQRAVERYGFKKCGVIYVADGSPRIAYQWNRPGTAEDT